MLNFVYKPNERTHSPNDSAIIDNDQYEKFKCRKHLLKFLQFRYNVAKKLIYKSEYFS